MQTYVSASKKNGAKFVIVVLKNYFYPRKNNLIINTILKILTFMKKSIIIALAAMALGAYSSDAKAQFLDRLKDKAVNTAKDNIERRVGDKTNEVMDNAIDGKGSKGDKGNKSGKSNDDNYSNDSDNGQGNSDSGVGTTKKKADNVMEYAKSDFVPGDEIIYEDLIVGEQLGEFPSRWDLMEGNAEIAKLNGESVIAMNGDGCKIIPLMKDNSKNYLGDVFTIEFDFLFDDSEKDGCPWLEVYLKYQDSDGYNQDQLSFVTYYGYETQSVSCRYERTSGGGGDSQKDNVGPINDGAWHHYAISVNKRAVKYYVDGVRIINVPNAKIVPGYLEFNNYGSNPDRPSYLRNVRIAKGAVPLYDRLETDGKIITYGITFATGKADLKPESMTEIARIAKLMQEKSDLKFEVQGHCDSQGSDAVNDPLSQKRAEAIVDALVKQGISKSRLTAVGKGSHSPIADNSTDEGRARNRRVEFIKK